MVSSTWNMFSLLVLLFSIWGSIFLFYSVRDSQPVPEEMEDSNNKDPKILILGAGMAGMSAAKALFDIGFTDFDIIEGSSRIGGRIKSVKLGNHSVELGAMWIYGKGANPVYKMARDSGLSVIDHEQFRFRNWTVRNCHGKNITLEADKSYDQLGEIMDKLNSVSYNELEDCTVREILQRLDWEQSDDVKSMVEDLFLAYEMGVSAENLSAKHMPFNSLYDHLKSPSMLPVDDAKGYQHLCDYVRSFIGNNINIQFNKHVTSIDQSGEKVVVHSSDNTVFRADYAIVTFSLGVIKKGELQFLPPLPKWKLNAIDNFGMCDFGHIYLQFQFRFWDDTLFLVRVSDGRFKNRFWLNMNHILPESNILQLSVYGEESRRIESLQDNIIVSELVDELRQMYPTEQVPFPVDFKISRWTSDPLFRGAFSYWPTRFTSENMEELAAPFGRIFFAGEHLNDKENGYVHSALESGITAANEILSALHFNRITSQMNDD